MLGSGKPHSSLILEDCVFETAYDSPIMSGRVACEASGGQVARYMVLQCFGAAAAFLPSIA
jgi:hypothetical protein